MVSDMPENPYSEVKFRYVKNLQGRAKEQALEQGLNEDSLVLVRARVGSLPEYEIIEVEGDPLKTLFQADKH